jgi:hypothetical protein
MKRILAVSLMIVFMASAAYAQFGAQQGPRFYGDFKPVVGAWSEYQSTFNGQPPMKMKVGIVGKEGPDYWYETVVQGETRMVSKMLVSGNPNDKANLKRMIVKAGNDQAMEMDTASMMARKQAAKAKPVAPKVIDKGMEKVTVPAGTFQARHLQYQEGADVVDAWVSDKVSPYGLVKSKSKDMEMVLTGQGTGAKTLITETPKKFTMPQMPKGMPMPKMPQGAMPGMGGAGN